jgi:hypothetical protein
MSTTAEQKNGSFTTGARRRGYSLRLYLTTRTSSSTKFSPTHEWTNITRGPRFGVVPVWGQVWKEKPRGCARFLRFFNVSKTVNNYNIQ